MLLTYENIFAAKTLRGGIDVFNFFKNIEQSEAQVCPGPAPPPRAPAALGELAWALSTIVVCFSSSGRLPSFCQLCTLRLPSSNVLFDHRQPAPNELCALSALPTPAFLRRRAWFIRPPPLPVRLHPERVRTTTQQVSYKQVNKYLTNKSTSVR